MEDIDVLMMFLGISLEHAYDVFEKFASDPNAIRRGDGLEQFLYIEGTRDDKVLLVAHADTYWDASYCGHRFNEVKAISKRNGIVRNANGGLGADDRAGCAMIWLLRNLGHSILITHGEEGGRIGSNWLMEENPDIAERINSRHQFAIQLDRRNGRDFKCYSVGTGDFRSYVGRMTGYSEPDRASYTDIVTLCRNICGVNLSVGYRNEHTENEYLIVDEWLNTLDICRKWLSAPALPRFGR